MPIVPSFQYEQRYWQQDMLLVAGVDEVGMGALAGPVCAAAVIFRREALPSFTNLPNIPNIRDSKTLTANQRMEAAEWIKEYAIAWAVGAATVEEINNLNIRKASYLAMRRAVDVLSPKPNLLLIDGMPASPHSTIPAVNIVDGDALSISIAAASILAKVHRDQLMTALDKEFPQYGFATHKGYGTKVHLTALHVHGASPHHRIAYAPVRRQAGLSASP